MKKTQQWALLTALAVLIVFAGGFLLLVKPQRSDASSDRATAAGAQTQALSLQSQLNQLTAEKKNLPEQEKTLASIATKIPADPAEPVLIHQIVAAANTAGVDMTTLSPSAPAAVAATAVSPTDPTATVPATTLPLYEIPVAISVTGSYFNVVMFEHEIEGLSRTLVVSTIGLSPETTSSGTLSGVSSGTTVNPNAVTATIAADVFLSPTTTTPASTSTTGITTPATTTN